MTIMGVLAFLSTQILDASASGVTVLTGTAAEARTALGLGSAAVAASGDFAAASHNHDDRYFTEAEITSSLGSYLTTASAASTYLPFTGGTLTGQLCTAPSVAAHSGFKIPVATSAPDTPTTGDMWVTLSGNDMAMYIASSVRNVAFYNRAQTYSAKQTFPASATGYSSINIAHGVTPTSPSNGDVWSTTAGWFVRTNGATEQLTTHTARISSNTSSSTPTPDFAAYDQYLLTALAANATFGAPTGTLSDGMKRIIRIKDNGTARTLSWNAIYRAIGVTLPSTTVISKTHYVGMVYNAADTKWDVVAVGAEA